MKFLERMHSKSRQANGDYLMEFAPERLSSNHLLHYAKSHYYVNPSNKAHRDNQLVNSFSCLDAASADDEHISELFHGFQTIRALEKNPLVADLATPNFATYVENMMKNETRTKEDELKLVKEKLEKMLFTRARKSIHKRTTTPGSTLLEAAAKNENESIANPLLHEVFVSEVKGPETIVKGHRASLRELFQKTNMGEEKTEPKSSIEKKEEKKNDKPSLHLMKKILKRRTFRSSSKHSTSDYLGTNDSASADEKLHNILRMLQRVYPEASAISKKSQKLWEYVTNRNFTDEESYRDSYHQLSEDKIVFPYKAISEMNENDTKSKLSHPIHGGGDTNWNRECWIKSDAEYLILEL